MKLKYKLLIGFAVLVILSNFQLGAAIFKLVLDEGHYRYSNSDGSMAFEELKPDQLAWAKRRHAGCLSSRPYIKDKQLYRLFPKNPLAFWRWRLYFTDDSYKLPYKNWKEIKKIRDLNPPPEAPGCVMHF